MRTSPLGSTIALPGPTGERNTLSFAARGTILCAASSLPVLLNQLAATLATGNQAVVLTDQPALLPDGFPPAVSDRIVQIASLDACHGDYQVALIETSLASTLKPLLAARDGALVTTIDTDAGTAIPLWRLVAERALCINTTAAGGNASLMTLGV
jgi:RHH-type proline utilization regulon transcriptional repressor/proline dehydrogenase/delta 1-pyrroline-5-carboxylate dehydrogenase